MVEKIARALRSRREELSLSQRKLARKAGVHSSYISKIEKGRERPAPEMARRLARAVEADPLLFVLAAGHVPDELRKAMLERESLRKLLRLAAAGELSEQAYRRLRELLAKENRDASTMVPVWPEEEDPDTHSE